MGISCRDLVLELLLSFLWHDLDLGLTADAKLDSDWELLPGLELAGVGRGGFSCLLWISKREGNVHSYLVNAQKNFNKSNDYHR